MLSLCYVTIFTVEEDIERERERETDRQTDRQTNELRAGGREERGDGKGNPPPKVKVSRI